METEKMIGKNTIKRFVRKGELEKIENYDKAIADKTQIWHCHHRLELTLDGEFAHTKEELKRLGMYYHRPYFELIFVTNAEHGKIHSKSRSEEHRKKLSEASKRNNGMKTSEEARKKVSESLKGRKFSEERRKHMSEAMKGKKLSEETRKKMSESRKRYFEKKRQNKENNNV